ncbi:MAG: class II glutamine amidotransferase [Elusimicrobiota bacterium]|nr:class II glutamine amidotransferase [Endomicrobiia bacterium]MDW8166440.1 class II glutamine amidotransferase [Elusimicrobiota bacterium]
MCRLFGLIANKKVDVKFSMLEAKEKFKNKAKDNPNGWGIGWYDENSEAKVEKYAESAFYSIRFDELVKEVKSKIIITHVRMASCGSSTLKKNAHPFIYKNWIFAHNGTVNLERIKTLLKEPYNLNFTSEPIDSEVYFRYLIQSIEEQKNIVEGIKKAVSEVTKDDYGANFIMSDGENLYGFCCGYSLYYLERDPKYPLSAASKETLALIEAKKLAGEKAVIIASEEITPKEENWVRLKNKDLLVVDKNLRIRKYNLF